MGHEEVESEMICFVVVMQKFFSSNLEGEVSDE
jgi:hypothetical protein